MCCKAGGGKQLMDYIMSVTITSVHIYNLLHFATLNGRFVAYLKRVL